MRERLLGLLASRRTYLLLIGLNILVGSVTVLGLVLRGSAGNDSGSYLALANGILHGRYSQYWSLPEAFPDTFRAPGFPAYLAVLLALTGTWRTVGIVQLALFVLSIHLTFRVMARFGCGMSARNVFLLLLLSSQNVLVYIPLVNPEVPAIACLALMTFADPVYRKPGPFTGAALGALAGFLFHCRPIFLLLPVARIAIDLLVDRQRTQGRTMALYAMTFGLTLLPFSLWNLSNHGVFKPTPLEGGGGVFHMGYWAGRIPGHQQHRYWGNFAADEAVRFVPEATVRGNIAAYEREWDGIDSALAPLLTSADSVMLLHHVEHVNEKSFNTQYTLKREALLKDRVWTHVRETPGYFIAYKAYTAVRLWVIGVDRGRFQQADLVGRITLAAPMAVTGLQFLLALIVIPLAHARGLLRIKDTWPMLLVVLYGWAISVPFTIQSRYTVPLRFLFFALTAMAVVALLERRRAALNTDKDTTPR